jgi:heat shock protein HslJ
MAGEDPVLDAAIAALSEEVARRSGEQLIATPWQWTGTYRLSGQAPVDNPAAYTLTFSEDGTLAIQADCNQAQAEYTRSGDAMTITPGPATLMACPGDSQGEQFVQLLGTVASAELSDGQMFLVLDADLNVESGVIGLFFSPVE